MNPRRICGSLLQTSRRTSGTHAVSNVLPTVEFFSLATDKILWVFCFFFSNALIPIEGRVYVFSVR
jgi:hypothetical protein